MSPPGYSASRFAQALGFSGEGELVSRGLKALSSLNLMDVLVLGGARKAWIGKYKLVKIVFVS